SATSITASSPAGSGTVDVTVSTAAGTSSKSGRAPCRERLAPTVTSVSPKSGPTAGGTSVSITGTNLSGANAVKFGSSNATSFTVNSATSITASSPAGSGTVDVTVSTATATLSPYTTLFRTYALAPTVTSVSPSSG